MNGGTCPMAGNYRPTRRFEWPFDLVRVSQDWRLALFCFLIKARESALEKLAVHA